MRNIEKLLSCLFLSCVVHVTWASVLWVEAESFRQKGGWSVDQQFIDQMGSSYLLAHGMGVPVKEASTKSVFLKKVLIMCMCGRITGRLPGVTGKVLGALK